MSQEEPTKDIHLAGPLLLHNGLTWNNEHAIPDFFISTNKDPDPKGVFDVTFHLESVIPLCSIGFYTLMDQPWTICISSDTLERFFLDVFKEKNQHTSDSRDALVIRIDENKAARLENGIENPFMDNIPYPLRAQSRILVYGVKSNGGFLDIQGLFIRPEEDYLNIAALRPYIAHVNTEPIGRDSFPELKVLRPSLWENSQYFDEREAQWDSQSKESSIIRVLKEWSAAQEKTKKVQLSREPRPTQVHPVKHLAKDRDQKDMVKAKDGLEGRSIKPVKRARIVSTSRQTTLSQPESPQSTTQHESRNKKTLKKLVWDKLMRLSCDRKSEDTKLLYQQIYQSTQFVFLKKLKKESIDEAIMNSVIDQHIVFYKVVDVLANG